MNRPSPGAYGVRTMDAVRWSNLVIRMLLGCGLAQGLSTAQAHDELRGTSLTEPNQSSAPNASSQPAAGGESSGWVMFQTDLSKTLLTVDDATSVMLTGTGATVRFRSGSSTLLGRTGGELDLVSGIRLDVGMSDLLINRGSAVGSLSLPGVDRTTGSKLADATLQADMLAVGPITLTAMGGGRGAMLDLANNSGASSSSPIAVAGAGASIKIDERTSIRGSTLTSVEPVGGAPYLEAKVEAALRLRNNAEISIGWQHLSGTLPVLDRRGDVHRNALTLEYKLAF